MQDARRDDDEVDVAAAFAGCRLDRRLVGEVDRHGAQSVVTPGERAARQGRHSADARVVEQGVDKGAANPAVGAGDDDMCGIRK